MVLTIAKLGVGQENYYLSTVARGVEDYYTGKGEVAGEWMGRGATRLGLAGQVTGDELRAALTGVDPISEQRLAGRAGAKRVPGWDLTFSAPKSVSVLYGLGGDDVAKEVTAAHRAAVGAGLDYLETHATVSRRRIDGLIEQVRGEGLVVAAFRHRTSRAGDPQLHTHALVANLVEHVGGGSGALHSPVIYRHARTAGFVYQAVLRGELSERLGIAWEPVHNGYAEVEGVDRRLLEVFSKRRAEIEAALEERGEDSARAAQVAAYRTRSVKEYDVDGATLDVSWRAEALAAGIDPEHLTELGGRVVGDVTDRHLRDVIDEMLSSEGLTASQASFDRQNLIRSWCEALPLGTKVTLDDLEDLAAIVTEDDCVVTVADGLHARATHERVIRPDGQSTAAMPGEPRWSTTEMLAIERALVAAATQPPDGAGQVPDSNVEQALRGRSDLVEEQAAMVRQVTTSGRPVDVVVGRAGSGKTYALAAAASIWRDAGYRPIGLGLAARAAHELESNAGIASTTVARFLLDIDQAPPGFIDRHHVLVVDEAGMVDTRRLHRLIDHAQRAGAKVVLIGDHHQLPAVEAGGAFACLVDRGGDNLSELVTNRRQREAWERDTLARLRDAENSRTAIEAVVDTYRRHGRVHVGDSPAEVRTAMVADWDAARRRGQAVAMIALRRSDVDDLNTRARALLLAEGIVASRGIDAGGRTYAVGDRVVCLENDRRLGVHNAMFATVIGTDAANGSVTIAPDGRGGRLTLPASYVADQVDHAYATTIHKAQGSTYDRALFLGDDRLYRQAGYTALSRGRDRNDIYLVVDDDREHDPELERHGAVEEDHPLDRFVRALNRDAAKVLAAEERRTMLKAEERPFAELWAERDALVQRLEATAPHAINPSGEETIELVRAREAQASIARAAQEERVASLAGIRHRGDRSLACRDLTQARVYENWCRERRQELEAVAGNATRADQLWLDEHDAEVERLGELDLAIARRTPLAGRAAELDRPRHIIDQIGEPPPDVAGREEWRRAAGSIESRSARLEATPHIDLDQHIGDPDGASGLDVMSSSTEALDVEPADESTGPSVHL